jgi:di/tricarboxylate transporter
MRKGISVMLHAYLLFIIIFLSICFFIANFWRYEVVACLALLTAVVLGIIPYAKAFSGFSNPAVIIVGTVMVLSKAITKTGYIHSVTRIFGLFPNNTTMHIAILAGTSLLFSSFMNNISAIGILMPIAIYISREHKKSPALVLMPLAFGALLGGSLTLISSPSNLLISAYRQQALGHPYGIFDFSLLGIIVAIFGVTFIALIGWRLLPKREGNTGELLYQIPDYITEVKVDAESIFVKKTIAEIHNMEHVEFDIIGIIRRKKKKFSLSSKEKILANDTLIIEATPEAMAKLMSIGKLQLAHSKTLSASNFSTDELEVIEAVVPPTSSVIAQSSHMLKLRSRYGIHLLAISRAGSYLKRKLSETTLKMGDVVLLQGNVETLSETVSNLGFVPLAERNFTIGMQKKHYLLFFIYLVAIALSSLRILPVEIAFSVAVLFLILFNIVTVRAAYDSIDWGVIFLLGGLIPLGEAMQTTGATALISNHFISLTSHCSSICVLTLIMIITMILSNLINFIAAAIVMVPIVIQITTGLHMNIDAGLMCIIIGANCAFLTPIAHECSVMVLGPGGYKFSDFFRLGLPLQFLVLAIAIPTIAWLWP